MVYQWPGFYYESISVMFVDDLNIYSLVKNIEDCDRLECDLVLLEEWCDKNQLSLNISKCKINTSTSHQ